MPGLWQTSAFNARPGRAGLALASFLLAGVAIAQETHITMTPPERPAETAMGLGDLATLDRLLGEAGTPIEQALLRAYKARTQSDLLAADAHAAQCSKLARADIPRFYESEAKCRSIIAGNAFIRGDLAQWTRLVGSALEAVEGQARSEAHYHFPGKFTANARVGLPGLWSLPKHMGRSPTFQRVGSSSKLDRVPFQDQGRTEEGVPRGPFSVRASADGQTADFIVDTGASTSLIGGALAARLGVERASGDGGAMRIDLHLQGRSIDTHFARLDLLEVGAFKAHDLAILVSADKSVPSVIGLDLIRNMGAVRFSERALEIGATSRCQDKLLLATDTLGTSQFVVAPVSVSGSTVMANIDTGNPALLIEFDAPRIAPWNAEFQDKTVNGLRGLVYASPKTSRYGALYNVGAGILSGSDLFIDLEASRLCLEPSAIN